MVIPIALSAHRVARRMTIILVKGFNLLVTMKKAYILFAGILLLAAGCTKEVDNKADVTTGKTITITASVDDQATRSQTALDGTTDKYKFTWANDEKISVVPSGVQNVLTFTVVDPTNGTFAYTPRPDDDQTYDSFIMAVSPQASLGEVIVDGESAIYEIRYIGSYFQEESNAIMVAGTPTTGSDGNKHFNFKHVGALVRVSYANVPAEARAMVFSTPDNAITGVYTFETAAGVEAVADDIEALPGEQTAGHEARVVFRDVPTDVQESVDFYLPIPTGQYQHFTVKLVDADDETIDGSEQTFETNSPFTVNRADVVECPVVTLTPPPVYYVKVNSDADLTSGQYLIVYEEGALAFDGSLTTLDASNNGFSVVITNGRIESSTEIDAKSFTISIGTQSTIKSASGYYIGNNSDSNSLSANPTTQFENTITLDQDGANIVSSGGAHLRYNANSGQERFRYFKSSTYTAQKAIALYKRNSTAPAPEKTLNSELYISGNIKKQFNVNESFSFGDGVVKANYSNGESKTLSVSDVTVSGFNSSVATDSQQITLTYTENGHSATGTYTVSIVGSVTGAKYKRVTALTSGKKYLIVAGNGDQFIMPHPETSGTLRGVSVSISNGEIESNSNSDACAFTITYSKIDNTNWRHVISYVSGGSTFYVAAGSKTALKHISNRPQNSTAEGLWTITTSSAGYGSFNIRDANENTRSILWRPSTDSDTWDLFGRYSGTGSNSYYNIELYEYTEATTE